MNQKIIGVITILVVLSVGMLWLLKRPVATLDTNQKLTIGATIFPLADIAQTISGDLVDVRLIVPPGVSEHANALTPQQLQGLQSAQVIFQIGQGLDDRLAQRVAQAFPSVRLVTVDKNITLREFGEEAEADPHYWLTVPNAQQIATTITEKLQEIDPSNTAAYQANLVAYTQQLQKLEDELQAAARGLPRKEFIAMHNAWSYFADHYGLALVATYEPTEGHDPSLVDLQHLQTIIKQHGITTFFAEPQKLSTAVTQFMQREFGVRVLTLDPVGGRAETPTYVDLMRFNMGMIAQGAR